MISCRSLNFYPPLIFHSFVGLKLRRVYLNRLRGFHCHACEFIQTRSLLWNQTRLSLSLISSVNTRGTEIRRGGQVDFVSQFREQKMRHRTPKKTNVVNFRRRRGKRDYVAEKSIVWRRERLLMAFQLSRGRRQRKCTFSGAKRTPAWFIHPPPPSARKSIQNRVN